MSNEPQPAGNFWDEPMGEPHSSFKPLHPGFPLVEFPKMESTQVVREGLEELQEKLGGQMIKVREKNSAVFASANFGFIPKGAIGKTVGLSYKPEAQ